MDIPAAIDLHKTALLRLIAGLFAMLEGAEARIPLALHRSIARVLRPAESAARRLIVTLAKIMNWKAPPRRKRAPPMGLCRAAREDRRRAFPLFDPRQRFGRQGQGKVALPRIRSLAPDGPLSPLFRERSVHETPDDLETSAHLRARLASVKDALMDLRRQVRRMGRALARRQAIPGLKLKMPLRPGPAPGLRKKPGLEIDEVLLHCDGLARETLAPNTS